MSGKTTLDEISSPSENRKIGYVIGGGLRENLKARLVVPSDEVQEGSFVMIPSGNLVYYGLVTNIQLGATDPRFADEESEVRLPHELTHWLHGQTLYTNLEILPVLMLERGPDPNSQQYPEWREEIKLGLRSEPHLMPVKTIPPHHADVHLAGEGEIAEIFGKPNQKGNFVLGYTREGGHAVCLDLDHLIQRSAGIFGATGSGKSFLNRMILAGLIQRNRASLLVFDMHNEYGFDDIASDSGMKVSGLKTLFPAQVRVVGLGAKGMVRETAADFSLEIAMKDIRPMDIELLSTELNLKETTPTTLEALVSNFGVASWFQEFRSMENGAMIEIEDEKGKLKKVPASNSVAAWANRAGVNAMAAEALHSKMSALFHRSYILEKPAADGIAEIVRMLQAGQHVILSFGDFQHDLDYLFITNLLTRYIREAWENQTNKYRTGKEQEPRPLVIVVEEAHKLLNRQMATQTIFNAIAREMRKYYVTLLIVDQRPSQIYNEVLSQLGTRISGWLCDEDDIHAVLAGLASRDNLRGMLTHLQPKEEVLLLGWGVPIPIPIRTRRYDQRFWQEIRKGKGDWQSQEQALSELGF